LNSRCGVETVVEGWLSHLVESMVGCLVGRIEGVTVLVLSVGIAGGGAGLHEDSEVDVAIMLSAVIRRRVPARILGL
jgi:hypothetical protein